mmetsp:Transcript_6054/g.25350  ORF Transcript_6054/g.25350 Transcript_6054/m.25350 type:complete len:256 (-) Transcript_6054:1401-2168(-)
MTAAPSSMRRKGYVVATTSEGKYVSRTTHRVDPSPSVFNPTAEIASSTRSKASGKCTPGSTHGIALEIWYVATTILILVMIDLSMRLRRWMRSPSSPSSLLSEHAASGVVLPPVGLPDDDAAAATSAAAAAAAPSGVASTLAPEAPQGDEGEDGTGASSSSSTSSGPGDEVCRRRPEDPTESTTRRAPTRTSKRPERTHETEVVATWRTSMPHHCPRRASPVARAHRSTKVRSVPSPTYALAEHCRHSLRRMSST